MMSECCHISLKPLMGKETHPGYRDTNGKPAPVLEMIKRVMLAYVMGNDDLHLKNLSLRRATPEAFYSFYDLLTPNYDVLFCGGFEHSAQNSFMPKAMRERAEVVLRERLNVMSPG